MVRALNFKMAQFKIAVEQIKYDAYKELDRLNADIGRQVDEWIEERKPKPLKENPTEILARFQAEQMRNMTDAERHNRYYMALRQLAWYQNPHVNGQSGQQVSPDIVSMLFGR